MRTVVIARVTVAETISVSSTVTVRHRFSFAVTVVICLFAVACFVSVTVPLAIASSGPIHIAVAIKFAADVSENTPSPVADVPKVFPIEFVMRGYLTGSTSTSIWKNYEAGTRAYCGHTLPEGMSKNQELPMGNILTPTTKVCGSTFADLAGVTLSPLHGAFFFCQCGPSKGIAV